MIRLLAARLSRAIGTFSAAGASIASSFLARCFPLATEDPSFMYQDHPSPATDALVELVCKGDANERQQALNGLADSTLSHKHIRVLLAHLQHPDPDTRVYAAQALGKLRATAATTALTECLWHDADLGLRNAAAQALASIGSPEALSTLGEIAQLPPEPDEEDWDDVWHNAWELPFIATRALVACGAPEALPGIRALLRSQHDDPELTQTLYCLLAQLPQAQAQRELLQCFHTPNANQQCQVLYALAYGCARDGLKLLLRVAEHSPELSLREAALSALSDRAQLNHLPTLLRIAQQTEGELRELSLECAQQVIKRSNGLLDLHALERFLEHSDPRLSELAQQARDNIAAVQQLPTPTLQASANQGEFTRSPSHYEAP